MSWTFPLPPRPDLALVFCPLWANVTPPALAYLRGALPPDDATTVIDLNGRLYAHELDTPSSRYWLELPDFLPVMGSTPDWAAIDEAGARIEDRLGSWLDGRAAELAPFGLVAFSVNQSNLLVTRLLARRLRRLAPATLLVGGGPSMTMDGGAAREALLAEGLLDLAVSGPGEEIFADLVGRLRRGEDLADLPGLHRIGETGPLATKAASSAFERFVLPDYRHRLEGVHYGPRADWFPVYAVRGCVGRCAFCTLHELHPGFRTKPFEWIRRELDGLAAAHGARSFFFSDPMFLASRERAAELFAFAVERDYRLAVQIRLAPYWDDDELVALAARCVDFLEVGLDGGSERVRRAMGKMASKERTLSILRRFWKADLPLYLNLIVGYPTEEEEDFRESLAIMEEHLEAFRRGSRVIGTGTNVFFLPHGFPAEAHRIEVDEAGHWRSPVVSVNERLDRIERLRALAESRGVDGSFFYAADSVEGIPLRRDDVDESEAKALRRAFHPTPSGRTGSLDRVTCHGGAQAVAEGWALHPDDGDPATEVLLADERNRIVARGPTGMRRDDVARALGRDDAAPSGFRLRFLRSRLAEERPLIRAWASDGERAWPLETAARLEGVHAEILRPSPPLPDGPTRRGHRPRRRPLFLALAALLVLVLPAVGIEVLLQARAGFRLHRSGWTTVIPPARRDAIHAAEKNQLGLRGRPYTTAPEDFVILLVGDSQVEARAMPFEAMPERLLEEALAPLARAWGRSVRVRSVAAGAWGQDQELLALRDYFARWRADLVLNWVTWENDLFNVTFADRYPTGNLKPTFRLVDGRLDGPHFPPGSLIYASRLRETIERFLAIDPASRWERELPPPYVPMTRWDGPVNLAWENRRAAGTFLENLATEKAHVAISLDPPSPRMAYSTELMHALLKEMAATANRGNASFLPFSVEHVEPCSSTAAAVLRSVARARASTWSGVFRLDGLFYRLSTERSVENRRRALGGLRELAIPMNLADWAVSDTDRHLNRRANEQVLGRLARLLPFEIPGAPPELAPPIPPERRLRHALGAPTVRRPWRGRRALCPGRIECEAFDEGGEGLAYHDTDEENRGRVLRDEGVDLHGSEAWACVGWVEPGEWLSYGFRWDSAEKDVEVFIRAVSLLDGQALCMSLDGGEASTPVVLPKGKDWEDYRIVSLGRLPISSGDHELTLHVMGVGMGLDYLELRAVPSDQ